MRARGLSVMRSGQSSQLACKGAIGARAPGRGPRVGLGMAGGATWLVNARDSYLAASAAHTPKLQDCPLASRFFFLFIYSVIV